jgi:hypothetical protein
MQYREEQLTAEEIRSRFKKLFGREMTKEEEDRFLIPPERPAAKKELRKEITRV